MNTEIREYLELANPWWQGEEFKEHMGIFRSEYVEKIYKAYAIKEVKILCGIRRAGKSTLLYQLIHRLLENKTPAQNIFFVNLENNLFSPWLDQANFLDRLLDTFKTMKNPKGTLYLFLDEIQEVPDWEKWVHKIYELKTPLHLTLTGSSPSLAADERATLVTGRNISFEMHPLSLCEYLFFKTGVRQGKKSYVELAAQRTELAHYFEKYLSESGFPAVVLAGEDSLKEALLKQYFQDILYRDLIRKHNIRHPVKLENLATYLVSNIGRALSYRKISNALGLAVDTLKEYLSYFEQASLFSFLDPFTFSTKAKLREAHNRKIYVTDHGLRRACGLTHGRDSGFLVENLVFQKLKNKKLLGHMEKPDLDFAYSEDGIHLIQVSYADELPKRELESFAKTTLKAKSKTLISKNTHDTVDGVQIIPAWYYLL